jgi:hypothetical protein
MHGYQFYTPVRATLAPTIAQQELGIQLAAAQVRPE